MEIYFDNSATTRPFSEAVEAAVFTMEQQYGNPSSLHRLGMNAENIVKDARETIAEKLNVTPQEIYFTSGGTESNNIAIIGACTAMRLKGTVITSKIEHKSVLECFSYLEKQGFNVIYLDVTKDGIVDLEQLKTVMNEQVSFVSIMHINNETGAIQPIEEISRIVKSVNPKALVHTDDVQGFCKIPFNTKCVDMISVSAHKVNGLKGCGAIYIKKGTKVNPVIFGGGQESGVRNGTENVPGIAAFKKAVEIYNPDLEDLKGYIEDYVINNIEGTKINSVGGSSHIINLSVVGFKSETLLHLLEQNDIYVSSGSACSSNKPQLSYVLTAMGNSKEVVESSIRLSFGYGNTLEQAKIFCEVLSKVVEQNKSVRRKFK